MTPPRVDTEVGPLRTVVLHRPGPELERLAPRNADRLLFDGIPWVERAQLEHDRFAATLARHGVRVLLLADLLRTALDDPETRTRGIDDAVDERVLGRELGAAVRAELARMGPDDLGNALVGGLTFRELGDGENSLVRRMHGPDELRRRPAAQPDVHPRLVDAGRRPRGGRRDGHAGATSGGDDDGVFFFFFFFSLTSVPSVPLLCILYQGNNTRMGWFAGFQVIVLRTRIAPYRQPCDHPRWFRSISNTLSFQ